VLVEESKLAGSSSESWSLQRRLKHDLSLPFSDALSLCKKASSSSD
jgi:hypothetical protein